MFRELEGAIIGTSCDTCGVSVIEDDHSAALEAGWTEVDHGIECPPCTFLEAERAKRDEEAGAADVVGEFALTSILLPGMIDKDWYNPTGDNNE